MLAMHASRLPVFALASVLVHALTLIVYTPAGLSGGSTRGSESGAVLTATLVQHHGRDSASTPLPGDALPSSGDVTPTTTTQSTPADPHVQTARAGSPDGVNLPLPERWLTADELDVRAEPLSEVRAVYPASNFSTMEAARVLVRLFIDERGIVRKAHVEGGAPTPLFEEAALRAWREVRFSPALKGGVAVKSQKLLEMDFRP